MVRNIIAFFLLPLVAISLGHKDPDETVDQSIAKALKSHGIDPANYHIDRNDGQIIEGMDMRLSPEQYQGLYGSGRNKRKAYRGDKWRWTNRTIPYQFEPDHFWPYQIKEMKEAMDVYMQETCLIFRPAHFGDVNKVNFRNGIGCSSQLGMYGGTQDLYLDWDGCRWMGLYFHEIGHAIGLVHEHQLPDRDKYIEIKFENVQPDLKDQFTLYKADELDRHGIPYDYASVMHYGINAFSIGGDKQTIKTRIPAKEKDIGRVYWKMLSFSDVKVINRMYKCDRWCSNVKCPEEGFVDKLCKCITPKSYYEEKCVDIHHDPKQCADWAKSGECDSNPGWMSIQCRKSCDRCPKFGLDTPTEKPIPPPKPPVTGGDGCRDKYDSCPTDFASCRTYDMIVNCQKSCNKCVERCEDTNKDCAAWARDGHCQSNPETVIRICPKSCGVCSQ